MAIKNYAKDKPNAVAMGAIAVGSNETSFKSRSHWIDTGIKDVLNATYIFIAKTNDQSSTTSQRGVFISAYDANATDKGLHIGVAATTASTFYTNSTGASTPLSLDPPFSTSAHKLYVIRLGATSIDFKCLTDNVSVIANVASSARKATNRNLLVGSSASAHDVDNKPQQDGAA